jgi:Peptidase family M23/Bacterial tandem repeat domain 1
MQATPFALALAVSFAAYAAMENPETGETCRGVDCVDMNKPSGGGSSAGSSGTSASPAWEQSSRNIYRIPYADGTEVNINHAVEKHDPPGRIDMTGRGGGPYRIVAAADGVIRFIVDTNTKQQNPKLAKICNNNYVWIEHTNGEWTKYSHMLEGTTTGKAGLKVGDSVKAGTYLGDEHNVGCAWPAHLHFEVGVPRATDPIDPVSGGLKDNVGSWRNRNPVICGIEGRTFQDNANYVAVAGPGEVVAGVDEVIRHGMPKHNYQCFLERAAAAGYQNKWIDFFNIGKDLYVNVVMRPRESEGASRSGMDADAFLQENASFKAAGYRVTQIESYIDGGVRYAALWQKTGGPAQSLYLGFSAEDHDKKVAELKAQGFRPKSISVVTHSGLQYTALWEQVSSGWEMRSTLTPAEYSAKAKENHDRGYEVVFLNSYVDGKQPYVSAIWHSGVDGEIRRRSGLGKKDFDFEWTLARKEDFTTTAVTAYEVNGHGEYAAVFVQ